MDHAAAQAANDGRWDEADRIWMQMRGREPNNRNALWGLGYSALQRGDAARARLLLVAAQKAAPKDRIGSADARDGVQRVQRHPR